MENSATIVALLLDGTREPAAVGFGGGRWYRDDRSDKPNGLQPHSGWRKGREAIWAYRSGDTVCGTPREAGCPAGWGRTRPTARVSGDGRGGNGFREQTTHRQKKTCLESQD